MTKKRIDCAEVVRRYLDYLGNSFSVKKTKYGCAIQTPFMGYSSDPYKFYVEYIGDDYYKISDYGNTINYLTAFGIEIKGDLKEYMDDMEGIFGIKNNDGEIYRTLKLESLGKGINSLLSAIFAISSFEFKKQSSRGKWFSSKVREYCQKHNFKAHYERTMVFDKLPYKIDIVSKKGVELVQTIGTSEDSHTDILNQTKLRTMPYMNIKLKKLEYNKLMVYDKHVGNDDGAMAFIEETCDDYFSWENKGEMSRLEKIFV